MPTAPIILRVVETGEVLVFPSADDAASYVESIDVENGEYEAFDGTGKKLGFRMLSPPRVEAAFGLTFHENVPVTLLDAEAEPAHEPVVRELLRQALEDVVSADLLADASLEQLAAIAKARYDDASLT